MSVSNSKRTLVALFAAVVAVYALVAWDRILEPSPQFHFVDLAHSFMAGELHTETPTQSAKPNKARRP